MGVKGLKTFLETKCREGLVNVDLKKLIEEYKRENNTDEAVLVMSIQCMSRYLYGPLDWLLGKQYKELMTRVESFVNGWERVGAKLVLFDGQTTTNRKRHVWIDRRESDIRANNDIFDILNRNSLSPDTENVNPDLHDLDANYGLIDFTKYMFEELNCEIRASLNEVDEEVAEYARENRCFACMANDTDYIIYNAAKYYFCLDSLDLKTMRVNRCDTKALARHLQIPMSHLPLLASLCGNDVIKKDDLKDFHRRLIPRYKTFEGVPKYIRKFSSAEINTSFALEEVAQHVFRNRSRASDLKESIKSYLPYDDAMKEKRSQTVVFPDTDWGDILSRAWTLSKENTSQSIVAILSGYPYELTSSFEDYRKKDLPVSYELLKPLRQRIYGILLLEKPDGPSLVQEWWISNVKRTHAPEEVKPVMPEQGLHPGLLALWDDDESLLDQRWELFARSVAPKLSAAALRDLPTHLVVPAAILCYLRKEIPTQGFPYLHEWELDALAITASLLATTDPSLITVRPPYNTRAIRLATVVSRCVAHMLLLLAACGFPLPRSQAMPWLFFDGTLFHKTYKSLQPPEPMFPRDLCVNQAGESVYSEYLQLRAFY